MNKQFRKVVSLALLSVFGLSLSNCASIVSRSKYEVAFNSSPKARVRILNHRGLEVAVGETPSVFRLRAKSGFFQPARYTVHFSREGYEDRIIPLNASFDPWFIGNLLFGGFIGLIVDPATGAMWKIEDDVISTSLVPKGKELAQVRDTDRGKTVSIYALEDIPEELKARMQAVGSTK